MTSAIQSGKLGARSHVSFSYAYEELQNLPVCYLRRLRASIVRLPRVHDLFPELIRKAIADDGVSEGTLDAFLEQWKPSSAESNSVPWIW